MYISSVVVKNFRCFRQAEASFVHRGGKLAVPAGALDNVTFLVGINGSGKTSILRAVALGVLMPILSESGYRPYYLVRAPGVGARQSRAASVRVDIALGADERHLLTAASRAGEKPDHLEASLEFTRRSDYDVFAGRSLVAMAGTVVLSAVESVQKGSAAISLKAITDAAVDEYYKDFSPSFFLLGYAASRWVEEPTRAASKAVEKSRGRRYRRVAGLFEDGVTLSPLSAWLPQIRRSARHGEVVRLLNRTLPAGTRFTGRFNREGEPVFVHEGVELPFPALSDGYRAYIGLIGDILCHVHDCCPKARALTGLGGVVMVDDIDLHLHPQWQRMVVPRLARAFPRLQFILTTHSPLVLGTVHAENVRVIGKHRVHQFSEKLNGLSVDQILSSPYFDYTKPRTDESERRLQALLEGPVLEGDAEPALQFLKELSGQGSSKK